MKRRWKRNIVAITLVALMFLLTACVSTNDNDDVIQSQAFAQTCAPKSRSRHSVNVESLSFACSDADGYNVGNGYYYPYAKNSMSTSCSAGELAQVTVDFWLKKLTAGSDVEVKVSTMYGGHMEAVLESTSLCDLPHDTLVAKSKSGDDDGYDTCNLILGKYRAYLNFTVPDFGFDDYDLSFTPDLRIQFFDSIDNFKIGCVETGTLAEKSLRFQREKKAAYVFMVCIILFVLVFSILLCWFKGNKPLSDIDIANKRALRRFHYRRTTKNGGVQGMDDDRSATSSISASEWSRRQFT